MYLNDLPKLSALYAVVFADDIYLCLSIKNLEHLQHRANIEIIEVDNLLRSIKLSLNYPKPTF